MMIIAMMSSNQPDSACTSMTSTMATMSLVGHRVEKFAETRLLVESASDPAIDEVRHRGNAKNNRGNWPRVLERTVETDNDDGESQRCETASV